MSGVIAVAACLLVPIGSASASTAGDLDPSFGDQGIVAIDLGVDAGAKMRIHQFNDGSFVIFGSYGSSYTPYLVWLASDGTVENVVDLDLGGVYINDMVIDSDGRVVLAGMTASSPRDFLVARYTNTGLDASFGSGGIVTIDFGGPDEWAYAVALDDTRILVSGGTNSGTGVARLLSDGSLDTSFSSDGQTTIAGGSGWGLAVASDSSVYVGLTAVSNGSGFRVARLTPTGAADTAYGSNGIAEIAEFGDFVRDIAVQDDGKAIVTGQECCDLGTQAFAVARFDAQGQPDSGFGSSGKVQFAAPNGIGQGTGLATAIQSDGRIVVAGTQQNAGETYDGALVVRLNSDGSFDESFGTGGKVLTQSGYDDTVVTDVLLQNDGRIVTAGYFGQAYSPLYEYLFVARYMGVSDAPPPSCLSLTGGFFAYSPSFSGGVYVAGGDLDGDGCDEVITGAGEGGGPHVRAFRADGTEITGFLAYGSSFTGGVRVAAGDLDGDGKDELITAPGPGGGPHVRVWELVNGTFVEKYGFMAYAPSFSGGVFVTTGDLNNDGAAEVITGPDSGGGPHIKVFSGASVVAEMMAYNSTFAGGVRVAVADVDDDFNQELVTAPGPSGGPHVRVWDFNGPTFSQQFGFMAYSPSFTGGIYVGGGDVDGDGYDEIITGPGQGGGPHVKVFAGANTIDQFMAYNLTFTGGVRVASGDIDGDGYDNIITGPGPGGGPHVRLFE